MRRPGWMTMIAVAALVVGCKSTPRTELTKEGISIKTLKGWKQTRHKQTAVFHDPKSRATIAVRAVPFQDGKAGKRDLGNIVSATRTALRGLPGAKLGESRALPRELFTAHIFDLSYLPPGKTQRYERRHAVFVGEHAIYHVWLTAPLGQLGSRGKLFTDVIDSLREEA